MKTPRNQKNLSNKFQCDTKVEARRPDIVLIHKTMKKVKNVDVNLPGDERVNIREVGKIEKYKVLKMRLQECGT